MTITTDIIGTIYTPGTFDSEGEVLTAAVALPGYHVNTTEPVNQWAAFERTPITPRRVFGGHTTFFYSFADEAEFLAHRTQAGLDPKE